MGPASYDKTKLKYDVKNFIVIEVNHVSIVNELHI